MFRNEIKSGFKIDFSHNNFVDASSNSLLQEAERNCFLRSVHSIISHVFNNQRDRERERLN